MSQKPSQSVERTSQPEARTPKIGVHVISLPSRGLLYGDLMPGGQVEVRKMKSGDMARLQGQGGNPMARIEAMVNACTTFPKGFTSKNLLLGDSFFLMLALRTLSFGPHYEFNFRCTFCGTVQKQGIDIVEDLSERKAPDDLAEPIILELPDADCIVEARFLRVSDQDAIAREAKRFKMASSDSSDTSYLIRLATMLVSRNGEPFSDAFSKRDFVNSLTAADAMRLDSTVDKMEPSVDLTIYPDCASCGAANEMSLPFDATFFRPSKL